MAAKGAVVKEELMAKLLEILPGSFSPDGKEIRVDMMENGNPVQIKIAMTAVKTPISNNPELKEVDEKQFVITEQEEKDLQATLNEMGVRF